MKLRFYTLWAINAPLDERRLCGQLDQMRGWGFDGAVFHPRFYPGVPAYLGDEYLAILSRVILYAQSIGMEVWLYDENGWPSGTVGGDLLQRYPADAQQWADLVMEPPADAADLLGSFEHEGQHWSLVRRLGAGVDYFSPALARHFLEMTYERYRQGLDPAAFAHVTTFFSDEPEFGLGHAYDALSPHGAIPWTQDLPELYRERYGEDLASILPLLFFPGAGHKSARVRFWELLTDLFGAAFITPINDWCRRHGKRFTAHVKGEEHPLFQVPMVGSAHQIFQRLGLPGIDALERYPSGNFFPRQVASAAQQFGNGDCMVEAFGGAGWGAGPEDLERYLTWLVGHGLNHVVLHLFQSQLTTHAMHDWPASIPAHVTWRDAFPQLLGRVRQHAELPMPSADTLIVAPYRGVMEEYEPRELLATNVHNAATYPDTLAGSLNRAFLKLIDRVQQSGVAYHICDERTVEEHGIVGEDHLRVGHCTYRNVIVAEGVRLGEETLELLSRLNVFRGREIEVMPQPAGTTLRACPPLPLSVKWQLQPGVMNTLVLEAEAIGDGQFIAHFEAATVVEMQAHFLDAVSDVTLNGSAVPVHQMVMCVAGTNEIRFRCPFSAPTPFVCVRGAFVVHSVAPHVAGPNGTVMTEGPFVLEAASSTDLQDLIASGYPFCVEPLLLRGTFWLSRAAVRLRLTDTQAACAQVVVDGIDCGWCWGPDWEFTPPDALGTGEHAIVVCLLPSTFNLYGPHHHIDGDIPVVSPVQYEYVKNFADRPDAPVVTRTSAWHFKPYGIGGMAAVDSDALMENPS